jgi:hypothetical protein
MSKEREFLKKLRYASLLENDLRKELEELLAQPEQEPTTRYALDSYWNQEAYQRGYAEAKRKLKREPLINKYVLNAFKADDEATHPYSYWAGVEFAEKYHGIGGGE